MASKQEAHYFKIGLFVIIGIVLLIGLVLLFNSATLFKKEILVETYFNESVQGLAVGSPVKYRGIEIGHVKDIGFVKNVYDLPPNNNNANRYIYVQLAISSNLLTNIPADQMRQTLNAQVAQGLRIKLAMQDLTGNVYVELNFVNPKQNPPLPIYWQPRDFYIPSSVSMLTRFADNVQNVLQAIQEVNFPQLFQNAQNLMQSANQTMNNANLALNRIDNMLGKSQGTIINTLQNAEMTSNNVRELTNKLKANPSQLLFSKPPVIDPSKL